MEEELNENELEEQFYSMLHYVDETQANVIPKNDVLTIIENAPRSTINRYWRPNNTANHKDSPYQKVNTPKETPKPESEKPKPKEERHEPPEPLPANLAIFQSLTPQNLKNQTIEIIEHDINNYVDLESSDEDEVIEVALPPKPTITIESSDEDDLSSGKQKLPSKQNVKRSAQEKPALHDREISASPVPSVVSSVSDEFIRSDCIALNISSRNSDNHSFDFSLHGADLLGQNTSTPSKKKKKKKNKTETPIIVVETTPERPATNSEEYFATPKSKAKNKKQRVKSYSVSEKSTPNPDVYDSDSNQSTIDTTNRNINPYTVTEKSVPSIDIYETDSNQSEITKPVESKQTENSIVLTEDSSDSSGRQEDIQHPKTKNSSITDPIIDLTLTSDVTQYNHDNSDIQENIIIGNVTGFIESDDYEDAPISQPEVIKYGSTKVPAILYEDLDFDNLKGKAMVCKNRRYSLKTLRAEMEKFYNESWGGEDFNHREIQKYMSRDKSLWAIDPKDKMPSMNRKKPTCNYCNRSGHRDDACRLKPAVCYMCGTPGHMEPRCPTKICVNCGAPNALYSAMCRNCCSWPRLTCAECEQPGHPASHCPDLWRRYHNTIEITDCLVQTNNTKKYNHLFCSGCTRRGHLVNTCRITLPFSGLPINSPYVHLYTPIYRSEHQKQDQKTKQVYYGNYPQDSTVTSASTQFQNNRNKRQSKSPTLHENHANKKRSVFETEQTQPDNNVQKKISESKETVTPKPQETVDNTVNTETTAEPAPDFIPIGSNRDKMGQIIQDNEVSDTSDAVTSARIYVTKEIIDKLKTKEGEEWFTETTQKNNVSVQNTNVKSFLSITGKFVDQESFQSALRDWIKKPGKEHTKSESEAEVTLESDDQQSDNIPKNRNYVLRKVSKALESLKEDLGEPNALFKELNFLQNRHQQLLKQKVINPRQLSNNRDNINEMLKKLNIILIGQAGLADGSKHVSELYSLQEKLINSRQKKLSPALRKEIGQHYHSVFTPIARDDYNELLQIYYTAKQSSMKKKKKHNSVHLISEKKTNVIPKQNLNMEKIVKVAVKENQKPPLKNLYALRGQLIIIRKKLLSNRPTNSSVKKTRVDLVRKLHACIASMFKHESLSSKAIKKINKIHEQANTYLKN